MKKKWVYRLLLALFLVGLVGTVVSALVFFSTSRPEAFLAGVASFVCYWAAQFHLAEFYRD